MVKMSGINAGASGSVAAAGDLMTEIQNDWATFAGAGAFVGALLSMNYGNWKFAMDEAVAKAAAAAEAKAQEQPEEEVVEGEGEEAVAEEEVPAELFNIAF